MREIVLDTETTGFNPVPDLGDDRLVEIGCVVLYNRVPTNDKWHFYLNPERDMPASAFAVHGLSEDFLSDKPLFKDVADDFLDFIGTSPLVIHNAQFDMKFINGELKKINKPPIPFSRAIDTLEIARKKFPGAQASLDALCRRFSIDNTNRVLHGALLDAELLAEVYLELMGGVQPGLELANDLTVDDDHFSMVNISKAASSDAQEKTIRPPRPHIIHDEEQIAHQQFLKTMKGHIWPS